MVVVSIRLAVIWRLGSGCDITSLSDRFLSCSFPSFFLSPSSTDALPMSMCTQFTCINCRDASRHSLLPLLWESRSTGYFYHTATSFSSIWRRPFRCSGLSFTLILFIIIFVILQDWPNESSLNYISKNLPVSEVDHPELIKGAAKDREARYELLYILIYFLEPQFRCTACTSIGNQVAYLSADKRTQTTFVSSQVSISFVPRHHDHPSCSCCYVVVLLVLVFVPAALISKFLRIT